MRLPAFLGFGGPAARGYLIDGVAPGALNGEAQRLPFGQQAAAVATPDFFLFCHMDSLVYWPARW